MDNQSDIVNRLQRMEDLLTTLVKAQLADVIAQEFSDLKMKKLYSLTGDYTARELARKVGCSPMKVSRVWQKWEQLGLVVKDGKYYRRVI